MFFFRITNLYFCFLRRLNIKLGSSTALAFGIFFIVSNKQKGSVEELKPEPFVFTWETVAVTLLAWGQPNICLTAR